MVTSIDAVATTERHARRATFLRIHGRDAGRPPSAEHADHARRSGELPEPADLGERIVVTPPCFTDHMASDVLERRFTADELTSAMDQLHGLSMATWHQLLVHVAEFDRAEAWKADGMVSMADWLIARYGLARPTALEWVRTSRALAELPAVADAIAAGRLSADQARWAIRLADPASDASVADDAPTRSAAELQVMARRAKAPSATDADEADGRRAFRWRDSADGKSTRVSGDLPSDAGATLAAAITRLATQAGPDPETGLFDPFEQRCADALVELAGAVLADDADADRATVVVHVPVEWFDESHDLDTAVAASLEAGVPLSHDTLRRLACDARVQILGEGPGAEALARTAVEHTIPPWLRRQLRHRDHGCRWRGCRRTRGVHAHHIVWFSRGGRTTLSNLVLLCRRHHRAVHEGGWNIEGDPAGHLHFIRPDGRALPDAPPPVSERTGEWLRRRLPALGGEPRTAWGTA